MIKTYTDLISFSSFDERFEYLKLDSLFGAATFGYDRYLNQSFYKSLEWRRIRREVILRDKGCDLALPNCEILGKIIVHHINPITIEDIENRTNVLFDMENLITVSHNTHQAITFGETDILIGLPTQRTKGDTCPWKIY